MTGDIHDKQQTFAIGAVAKLTGLSDHTIRVWERRYQAVVATRSQTGRREYSAADVEKLGLLKALTDRGVAIGGIARESTDELRARAASMSELGSQVPPENISIAILGDFLPARFKTAGQELAPLSVVVAENNEAHFAADITQHSIDVLVLEFPILNADNTAKMRGYMADAGATRGVFIYDFGMKRDTEHLRESGVAILRAPVGIEDVKAAVVSTFAGFSITGRSAQIQQPLPAEMEWNIEGSIKPRRFSQQQLATLANQSSTIECECPTHLAQLVGSLSAFEVYSASCANRNDEDAALHRYLHRTSADARAMIEEALERVAQAEGLKY